MNDITELLRPHVSLIAADAQAGDKRAKQVIALHRMHIACPSDPGAPALCQAAFEEWLRAKGGAS